MVRVWKTCPPSTPPSRLWLATESPANSCSEIFSVTGGVASDAVELSKQAGFSNLQSVQCSFFFFDHHHHYKSRQLGHWARAKKKPTKLLFLFFFVVSCIFVLRMTWCMLRRSYWPEAGLKARCSSLSVPCWKAVGLWISNCVSASMSSMICPWWQCAHRLERIVPCCRLWARCWTPTDHSLWSKSNGWWLWSQCCYKWMHMIEIYCNYIIKPL